MARTKYFIQQGLIVKKYNDNDKDVPGLFDLDKWFKKELTRYNVAYYDACCDEGSDYLPARFNILTDVVEYFNGEEWIDIADAPVATTTTTTTIAPATTTTTTTVGP